MKRIRSLIVVICSLIALPLFSQSNINDSYLKQGYKGMVNLGYGIGTSKWGTGRIEIATVHGYQLFPYLYIGAGIGINYYPDRELWNLPLFADIRGYLPLSDPQLSPYADIRVGYSVADIDGFYFSPSIGLRYGITKDYGLAFAIGYELQSFDLIDVIGFKRKNNTAFTMRFSFDF